MASLTVNGLPAQPRLFHVPGSNWATPCAPVDDTASGCPFDSSVICAETTLEGMPITPADQSMRLPGTAPTGSVIAYPHGLTGDPVVPVPTWDCDGGALLEPGAAGAGADRPPGQITSGPISLGGHVSPLFDPYGCKGDMSCPRVTS